MEFDVREENVVVIDSAIAEITIVKFVVIIAIIGAAARAINIMFIRVTIAKAIIIMIIFINIRIKFTKETFQQ